MLRRRTARIAAGAAALVLAFACSARADQGLTQPINAKGFPIYDLPAPSGATAATQPLRLEDLGLGNCPIWSTGIDLGFRCGSAGTDYQTPLTFSTGLHLASSVVTANISTGVSGGQTAYGGTAAGDALTLQGTTNSTPGPVNVAVGTTSGQGFRLVRASDGVEAGEFTPYLGGSSGPLGLKLDAIFSAPTLSTNELVNNDGLLVVTSSLDGPPGSIGLTLNSAFGNGDSTGYQVGIVPGSTQLSKPFGVFTTGGVESFSLTGAGAATLIGPLTVTGLVGPGFTQVSSGGLFSVASSIPSSSLAPIAGLSVLGTPTTSTAAPSAVTATGANQVYATDSSGSTAGFRSSIPYTVVSAWPNGVLQGSIGSLLALSVGTGAIPYGSGSAGNLTYNTGFTYSSNALTITTVNGSNASIELSASSGTQSLDKTGSGDLRVGTTGGGSVKLYTGSYDRLGFDSSGTLTLYSLATAGHLQTDSSGHVSVDTATYESLLTFSTGLYRSVNTITANISTGVSGGQSAIGGTGSTDSLTLMATSATPSSGARINFQTTSDYFDATSETLTLNGASPVTFSNTGSQTVTKTAGGSLIFDYGTAGSVFTLRNDGGFILSANANVNLNTTATVLLSSVSNAGIEIQSTGQGAPFVAIGQQFASTSGINIIQYGGTSPTAAASSGLTWNEHDWLAKTLTLTGTTTVTGPLSFAHMARSTITDSSAVTVAAGATLTIDGCPIAGGSVTISNCYALDVLQGGVNLAGGATIGTLTGLLKGTSGAVGTAGASDVSTALGTNSSTGILEATAGAYGTVTVSTGLHYISNVLTADLSTGESGGQSIIGGTAPTDGLTIKATSATPTSGARIWFQTQYGNDYFDPVVGTLGLGTGSSAISMFKTGDQLIAKANGALDIGTSDSNSLVLETNGTPALTIDASQGVTFPTLASAGTQCAELTSTGKLLGTGTACGSGSSSAPTGTGLAGVTSSAWDAAATTVSTGLTRSSYVLTVNLSTGVSGGQSAIGGTGTTDSLTLKATNATPASGARIQFQSSTAYYDAYASQMLMPIGSASAPGFGFVGAANYGMFQGSTLYTSGPAVGFAVNGGHAGGFNANGAYAGRFDIANSARSNYVGFLRSASDTQVQLETASGIPLLIAGNASTSFATASLSTSFTTGYVALQGTAGTPTGTPASIPSGQVPAIFDTTNDAWMGYNSSWKRYGQYTGGLASGPLCNTTSTGVWTACSASTLAAAQTWPASTEVNVSTGTTTAPGGSANFLYNTSSDLMSVGQNTTDARLHVPTTTYSGSMGTSVWDNHWVVLGGSAGAFGQGLGVGYNSSNASIDLVAQTPSTGATNIRISGKQIDIYGGGTNRGLSVLTGGGVQAPSLVGPGLTKADASGNLSIAVASDVSAALGTGSSTGILKATAGVYGTASASDISTALGASPGSRMFYMTNCTASCSYGGSFTNWFYQGVAVGANNLTSSSAAEYPIDFVATNARLKINLTTNGISAGTYTVQVTRNGASLSGQSFTSASTTGSYSVTMSTGSSSVADTYGLILVASAGASGGMGFTAEIALTP